jgi:hypothetical protein
MEYRPGITYNLTRPGISNLFFLALLVNQDPTHAPSSSWVYRMAHVGSLDVPHQTRFNEAGDAGVHVGDLRV